MADGSVNTSVLPSGAYLPLSGGTLTGALNGTSAAFSGAGSFGTTDASYRLNVFNSSGDLAQFYQSDGTNNRRLSATATASGTTAGIRLNATSSVGGDKLILSVNSADVALLTPNALLVKTTTDNGTDALQVAGSASFTGALKARGGYVYGETNNSVLRLDEAVGALVGYTSTFNNYAFFDANGTGLITNGLTRLSINNTGAATFSSSVTASSFIRSGGTSSQFLKADGSVDANTYITSTGAVTSIAGTANQISVSSSTGAVTVSLPSTVTISGAMTASGFFESSSIKLKDVISRDGEVAYFKWKDKRDDRIHIGYIAEEVQKKNPDQVMFTNDHLAVNYIEILVQKVRALEKKIEKLEKKDKKTKKAKN
jgi:hypothetical protein